MIADTFPTNARLAPTIPAQWAVIAIVFATGFLELWAFERHLALATIMVGPGIMLATTYSMRPPQRGWMLAAMMVAMALGYILGGWQPPAAIASAILVGIEAYVGAYLLGLIAPRGLDLTRARSILNLALITMAIVPLFALSVSVAAPALRLDAFGINLAMAGQVPGSGGAGLLMRWILPQVLGIILATPLVLGAFDRRRQSVSGAGPAERLLILSSNLAVTAALFYSDGRLFLFLTCPPLIWAALRLGIRDTALAALISLLTASFASAHGHGPAEVLHIEPLQRALFLALTYLYAYACILPIAASLEARRRLGGTLERNLAFSRQILTNMHEVVFGTDANGQWTFLNPAWEGMSGYTVADSLGQDIAPTLFAGDISQSLSVYARLSSGEVDQLDVDCRIHSRDGDIREVEACFCAIRDPDGTLRGTTGTIRAMSEQRRYVRALEASEKRFRQLCDTAPIGIVRCDNEGVISYLNGRIELITLCAADRLLGKPLSDVFGLKHAQVLHALQRTLHTGFVA